MTLRVNVSKDEMGALMVRDARSRAPHHEEIGVALLVAV